MAGTHRLVEMSVLSWSGRQGQACASCGWDGEAQLGHQALSSSRHSHTYRWSKVHMIAFPLG